MLHHKWFSPVDSECYDLTPLYIGKINVVLIRVHECMNIKTNKFFITY